MSSPDVRSGRARVSPYFVRNKIAVAPGPFYSGTRCRMCPTIGYGDGAFITRNEYAGIRLSISVTGPLSVLGNARRFSKQISLRLFLKKKKYFTRLIKAWKFARARKLSTRYVRVCVYIYITRNVSELYFRFKNITRPIYIYNTYVIPKKTRSKRCLDPFQIARVRIYVTLHNLTCASWRTQYTTRTGHKIFRSRTSRA